jgi:biopolymer transport protein ExbD
MVRKAGRQRQRLVAEINITPFTDVILVLLVIFMITAPLISQTHIQVKLPEVGSTRPMENASRIEVTVTELGMIYLDKDLVTEQSLKDKVGKIHKNNPNVSVVLRADKSVKFRYIVKVLDILTELGVKNLNISAVAQEQAR